VTGIPAAFNYNPCLVMLVLVVLLALIVVLLKVIVLVSLKKQLVEMY